MPSVKPTLSVDPLRTVVFPNRVREARQRAGFARLLPFAGRVAEIPYIRLSKIERGEVVPRAHELAKIADALGTRPEDLLLDVEAAHFSIERWAAPFADRRAPDLPEEVFALSLAAAIRLRRQADRSLTIAAIERQYGIAPVTLSRIENAQRPFARWNAATRAAIFALLDVTDEASLRARLDRLSADGSLHATVATMQNPTVRTQRMRERTLALRAEIVGLGADGANPMVVGAAVARRLSVFGAPFGDGLVARAPTGITIADTSASGPRAFGLRLGRPTLGGGLPGNAIVVVDPDRYPTAGGLAVVREGDVAAVSYTPDADPAATLATYRIVAVTVDRDGRMFGYSTAPAIEIALQDRPSEHLGAIVSAHFS
ncbi:helix-turn-helix domain-containing protein [Sphingomonas echinoides]|uniref:helix-turn-helix domain-containing protein n=1 Tax=Sphingomonas echinoides TaxID=59803 RepID=UPI002413016E|nr:helix-turn-helix transcriptional regulator [Sphingomonas echinoides]